MRTTTVQGVMCACITANRDNDRTLHAYGTEVLGEPDACAVCPMYRQDPRRDNRVCNACGTYKVPTKLLPILIMRGLKV